MEQLELLGVTRVKRPMPLPERKVGYRCWDSCKSLDPEMHTQNNRSAAERVYRICKRIGCKCYPRTEVCEWTTLLDDIQQAKPMSRGWSDY